jgi:hypothetical protein
MALLSSIFILQETITNRWLGIMHQVFNSVSKQIMQLMDNLPFVVTFNHPTMKMFRTLDFKIKLSDHVAEDKLKDITLTDAMHRAIMEDIICGLYHSSSLAKDGLLTISKIECNANDKGEVLSMTDRYIILSIVQYHYHQRYQHNEQYNYYQPNDNNMQKMTNYNDCAPTKLEEKNTVDEVSPSSATTSSGISVNSSHTGSPVTADCTNTSSTNSTPIETNSTPIETKTFVIHAKTKEEKTKLSKIAALQPREDVVDKVLEYADGNDKKETKKMLDVVASNNPMMVPESEIIKAAESVNRLSPPAIKGHFAENTKPKKYMGSEVSFVQVAAGTRNVAASANTKNITNTSNSKRKDW